MKLEKKCKKKHQSKKTIVIKKIETKFDIKYFEIKCWGIKLKFNYKKNDKKKIRTKFDIKVKWN
jgi:hypothetical protein